MCLCFRKSKTYIMFYQQTTLHVFYACLLCKFCLGRVSGLGLHVFFLTMFFFANLFRQKKIGGLGPRVYTLHVFFCAGPLAFKIRWAWKFPMGWWFLQNVIFWLIFGSPMSLACLQYILAQHLYCFQGFGFRVEHFSSVCFLSGGLWLNNFLFCLVVGSGSATVCFA